MGRIGVLTSIFNLAKKQIEGSFDYNGSTSSRSPTFPLLEECWGATTLYYSAPAVFILKLTHSKDLWPNACAISLVIGVRFHPLQLLLNDR